ncbi:MAG TPA: ATP-binding protein [Nitrospiria bacterium]|nr:ATP-binding protein [Nitrospiria bacterium]
MNRMRLIWSYRWRVAWVMLLLLVCTTGLFFLFNYQIERQIVTDQIRQRAQLVGKTVRLNLFPLLVDTQYTNLDDLSDEEKEEIREYIRHFSEGEDRLDLYSRGEGVHDLFFIDLHNRVVIDDPEENEGRLLPPDERIDPAAIAFDQRHEIDTRILTRGRNTFMLLTFPVFQGGRLLGFGRIEMSMNAEQALLAKIKRWDLITGGGALLLGLLLATTLATSVTKPIGELVQAARRIGEGRFQPRLDESRKDEIGVLMAAFNRMADGISRLEETQQRIKKLEIAGQLGALVAHEIKNPLNSIGLTIDHLRDRFAPSDPETAQRFLTLTSNITNEVDRLNQIVEGFLRSAKPPAFSRQPIDINNLIDEATTSIAPQAQQQQVKIHRQFDRALPTVSVDYHQLRQALLNLMINALQAMPKGGELTLSTRLVDGAEGSSPYVAIAVKDTGCGIPPEHLPHLFDPYFTTKPRGFGLGLSMVEQIVQHHEGRIDVTSQPGNGSVFTLLLPIGTEHRHA